VGETGDVSDGASPDQDAERLRLRAADEGREPWRRWGPYVADRAWGSVREDYSTDGDAWASFPYEQARSRTYRWNEDGLCAWSDDQQRLCVGLALWNGVDPHLKERFFGLTNAEGNHGEDVKEYWWNLDNTPTHSWTRTRYLYPTTAFPYDDLRVANAHRTRDDAEYELIDTGVFADDRFAEVVVDWAKSGPQDLCLRIAVTNKGPDPITLHVLPTLWFRNTWSWDPQSAARPILSRTAAGIAGHHDDLGDFVAVSSSDVPASPAAVSYFCQNETNVRDLFGSDEFAGAPATAYPKDGIGTHVVEGRASVDPAGQGTKAAFHHRLDLAPGETHEVRLRLTFGASDRVPDLTTGFDTVLQDRRREADVFWDSVLGRLAPPVAEVARQALSGLLASKQFYLFEVRDWLAGDPLQPKPPQGRGQIRNGGWDHLSASDVIVMPDAWEYPWFASWDLAFHGVALALVDPELAKAQILLLLDERYQHPNGQIPAYEWSFDDLNPPVQAWAALQVYAIDGSQDRVFLERVLHKLLINVGSWFNRSDERGDNLFEGGFLGLDNIGPFDRSQPLPDGALLEQSDGTAWMALFCLNLLEIATILGQHDPGYDGLAATFLDRLCAISVAANELGLWDEPDGFYYDLLRFGEIGGERVRVRSAVGLVPLMAVHQFPTSTLEKLPRLQARLDWMRTHRPDVVRLMHFDEERFQGLLALCDSDRLERVLARMLDPAEFWSPHGIRSLSAVHRDHPAEVQLGDHTFSVDYEPAESRSGLYGGNSNWRGPIWLPVNALLVAALRRFDAACRDDVLVPCPAGAGAGAPIRLGEVADQLTERLISLFVADADGHRPCLGALPWQDAPLFFEYFDGDDGRGLGASHQTGWTALVASLALGWPR
jgi:hypothetical protein